MQEWAFCSYTARSSQFCKKVGSKNRAHRRSGSCRLEVCGGACCTLLSRIAPPSDTFRGGGTMNVFGIRRGEAQVTPPQPNNLPSFRATPTPGGVLLPFLGEGLSPLRGGERNTAWPGTLQTRPGPGWEVLLLTPGRVELSPLVGEVITCSAPVYVLIFTCGRLGSRNLRRRPTRPAPVGGHLVALFSHLRQVRDSKAPCPLGGPRGPVALLLGL